MSVPRSYRDIGLAASLGENGDQERRLSEADESGALSHSPPAPWTENVTISSTLPSGRRRIASIGEQMNEDDMMEENELENAISVMTNADESIPDQVTRIIAFFSSFTAHVTVMLIAPFFQDYVSEKYHASDTVIGITFACNPLAQILSMPLWNWVRQYLGRSLCMVVGLILLSIGSLIFTFGDGIPLFMVGRFLQGMGLQGTLQAAVALIMETSDDLESDMGVQEFVVGMGFMAGPVFGGIMFQHLGFIWAVLPSCILAAVMAVASLVVLQPWRVPPEKPAFVPLPTIDEDETFEGADDDLTEITDHELETFRTERDIESGPDVPRTWVSLMRATVWDVLCDRTSAGVCICLVAHAAAQSFGDMVLGQHLQLSRGTRAGVQGAAFAVMPFAYSICCYICGQMSTISNHTLLATGLVLYAVGYYLISPPFFFVSLGLEPIPPTPFVNASNWFPVVELSRAGEWTTDMIALTVMGFGSALVLVPSVPLMRDGFSHSGLPGDPTDAISSAYAGAWSLGELIGPPIGGAMLEMLPPRRELNCNAGEQCYWAFYWSMTAYSIVLGSVALLFILLVPNYGDYHGKEHGTIEEEKELLSEHEKDGS